MKKVLLSLMLFPFIGLAQLPETFELEIPSSWAVFNGSNGLGTEQNWVWSDGVVYSQWEAVESGQVAEDWLVTPGISVTSTAYFLSFDTWDNFGTDYGSEYSVRISTSSQTDISSFSTVSSWTEADVTAQSPAPRTVDLSDYIGETVYIAFVHTQNDGDVFFLDNVNLSEAISAPEHAINPTPADGAVNVPLITNEDYNGDGAIDENDYAVEFSWEPGSGPEPTGYQVATGDSPDNLTVLGTTPNTSVAIYGGFAEGNVVYWQIIPINAGGSAVDAPVWSFTIGTLSTMNLDGVSQKSFVYPNPAKAMVNVRLADKFDAAKTTVTLTNVNGKKVGSFSDVNAVNVERFPAGVYIMTITDGVNTETKKLIKK